MSIDFFYLGSQVWPSKCIEDACQGVNERIDWMTHRYQFADSIANRSIIGSVYLASLLIFFGAQLLFTAFLAAPPLSVFLLVGLGSCLRTIEILAARRIATGDTLISRRLAVLSIAWTLALALLLALLTHQPDTHYFGMLILPILEAAIYFSLATTLVTVSVASAISLFWVAYVSHFRLPFNSGE